MPGEITLSGTTYQDLLASPGEMAEFDSLAIKSGIPSLQLMKSAGKALHAVLQNADLGFSDDSKVLVLCGPGNNGGDGFVLARELLLHGAEVECVLCSAEKYSKDLLTTLMEFSEAGGKIWCFGSDEHVMPAQSLALSYQQAAQLLSTSDVLIDALLGTGQKQAPRGSIKELLEQARTYSGGALVIAVDIPSGVNGDTGEVYEPCIQADATICLELVKRGLTQYPARSICGDIIAVSIGIDCSTGCEYQLNSLQNIPQLAVRNPASHKHEFGNVLVIGGSADMPGAPFLAGSAALRSGAGLVRVAVPRADLYPQIPAEIMLLSGVGKRGFFEPDDLDILLAGLGEADALVCGPGLGRHVETRNFLIHLLAFLENSDCALVLDADALNLIEHQEGISLPASSIMTPHPGEMARLLGISSAEVQRDRFSAARNLANKYQSTVVLKGASSVLHSGYQGAVNDTGNPYMATAGSGDVLCGVLAALLAQGMSPFESARAGVFLHGLAGDLAHSRTGAPLLASDIIQGLAEAFSSWIIE